MTTLTKEQMAALDMDCEHYNTKEKSILECESNGHYLCVDCKNYTGTVFERLREDWEYTQHSIREGNFYRTTKILVEESWHCGDPTCNRPTNNLWRCNVCFIEYCLDCFKKDKDHYCCDNCLKEFFGGK